MCMNHKIVILASFLGFFITSFDISSQVLAQIIPDGTLGKESSVVTPIAPNTKRIDGGAIRGSNLFHSFREFNINSGNATYFSNPASIRTIFSRVTGNNPSLLLGKLGVDGHASLFFINPNGIIFGKNASLDLKGAFIGTNANNISFPDGNNFSATNPQGPPLLTIDTPTPIGLEFASSPGTIINAGNLQSGTNLSLISGTVVSSGKLSTPQGNLSLVTISSENNSVVKLDNTGKLNSEIITSANSVRSTPKLSLPELVNYSQIDAVVTINRNQVKLVGSNIVVNPGDIVIAGELNKASILAHTGTVFANNNLILFNSQIGIKENLNLLANNSLVMRDSQADPLVIVAGKDLLARGNDRVDIFALNHPQSELSAGRNLILRAGDRIGGDAHFWSGESFRIEKLDGSLGNLFSPRDPIICSLGDVSFDAYEGASLHILAGGSVNISSIIITDVAPRNQSINPIATPTLANVNLSDGTTVTIDGSLQPTLDIRAGMNPDAIGDPLGVTGNSNGFFNSEFSPDIPNLNNINPTRADININEIILFNNDSQVLLTNRYHRNLVLTDGDININLKGNSLYDFCGYTCYVAENSNFIVDSASNINIANTDLLWGGTGSIKLLARDRIKLNNTNIFNTNYISANSGYINLQVTGNNGEIILENQSKIVSDSADNGNASNIKLEADRINLNNSEVYSLTHSSGNTGKINIITDSLRLNESNIYTATETSGNAGAITINSKHGDRGDREVVLQQASNIYTSSLFTGNAGNIEINKRIS
jgi:filamentous hemagglutinin family protein